MSERRKQILDSLREAERNSPVEFQTLGFWVQGESRFVPAITTKDAIQEYRNLIMASAVGISHNHNCADIRVLRLQEELDILREVLDQMSDSHARLVTMLCNRSLGIGGKLGDAAMVEEVVGVLGPEGVRDVIQRLQAAAKEAGHG